MNDKIIESIELYNPYPHNLLFEVENLEEEFERKKMIYIKIDKYITARYNNTFNTLIRSKINGLIKNNRQIPILTFTSKQVGETKLIIDINHYNFYIFIIKQNNIKIINFCFLVTKPQDYELILRTTNALWMKTLALSWTNRANFIGYSHSYQGYFEDLTKTLIWMDYTIPYKLIFKDDDYFNKDILLDFAYKLNYEFFHYNKFLLGLQSSVGVYMKELTKNIKKHKEEENKADHLQIDEF